MTGNFFGGAFFGGGFFGKIGSGVPAGTGAKRSKGKRPVFKINLKDALDRDSTAEYLKSQLALRHPDSAFQGPTPAQAEEAKREARKVAKREAAMRAKAKSEANAQAMIALDLERVAAELKARETAIHNENTMILMTLAAAAL